MATRLLLVEGSDKSKYLTGWRQGFAKILQNAGVKRMPKIIPSGGRDKAIDEYKKLLTNSIDLLLLIDLDGPLDTKSALLAQKGLSEYENLVFFSIQEIEAWFLSQPKVLDDFFGIGLNGKQPSARLSKRNPSLFNDPKQELKRITKGTKRGTYIDTTHGPQLLQNLDAIALCQAFPDEFGRLIIKLNK